MKLTLIIVVSFHVVLIEYYNNNYKFQKVSLFPTAINLSIEF
jgi:hypothetical protein